MNIIRWTLTRRDRPGASRIASGDERSVLGRLGDAGAHTHWREVGMKQGKPRKGGCAGRTEAVEAGGQRVGELSTLR